MLASINHVIWDWNGTLVNDVQICLRALNAMLSKREMAPVTLDEYRTHFHFPVKSYYEQLGFDFDVQDWHELSEEFFDVYDHGFQTVSLREGVRPLLASLSDHVEMSVLSVTEGGMLDKQVRALDLHDLFYSVNGTDDFYAASKLASGQRWLDTHGFDPKTVVLVGDTVHDHEVAQALGIQSVLVADGHMSPERLRASGADVVNCFNELKELLYSSM